MDASFLGGLSIHTLMYGFVYGANFAFIVLSLLFVTVNYLRGNKLAAKIHGFCFFTFLAFIFSMVFCQNSFGEHPLFSDANWIVEIGRFGMPLGLMSAIAVYISVFNVFQLQPSYRKVVMVVLSIVIISCVALALVDSTSKRLFVMIHLVVASVVLMLFIHHTTKYLSFIVYARIIRNITIFIGVLILPYVYFITRHDVINAVDLFISQCLITFSLFLFHFFLAVYGYEQIKYFRKMHLVDKELLLHDLSKAVEQNDFYMVYQPQLDLHTKKICGFEALIRWKHPKRGLVPPNLFIPIAESTGLINKISFWVIKTVIKQCTDFIEKGLDIRVSINLSAKNLNPSIVKYLVNKLRYYKVPPEMLVVEITETSLMKDTEEVRFALNVLKQTGCYISLDDYGTGFSSLSYLNNLDLEELKIDQCFIKDIDMNHNSRIIVDSTLKMSKSLNLRVVAEGAETDEVIESLLQMECDVVQGYGIAKPMQVANLYLWLKENADGELVMRAYDV